MPERSYRRLLWALAVTGLLLDLSSKYLVFRWLYNDGWGDSYELVPGWFQLLAQYTRQPDPGTGALAPLRTWSGVMIPKVNHGALFGLANQHESLANGLFALVSVTAAVAIAVWSTRRSAARDGWLCAALGLILGGTLGNLYDRVVFNGVRDFLYFYWINWPVFNVADCCLVCGACLLLAQAFLTRAEQPAEQAATPLASEVAQAK